MARTTVQLFNDQKPSNKSGFRSAAQGIDRDAPGVKKTVGKDLRTNRSKGGK